MHNSRDVILCRYHYDPLDRVIVISSSSDAISQRFYCKNRLTTEIQGSNPHSVFQQGKWLLAQHWCQGNTFATTLLATDQQRSVLLSISARHVHPITYSPYGHRHVDSSPLSLLGFNGERPDPETGHYLLGNGYRAFNPALMRFNSPDNLSPFGKGGLNPYTYCLGDPINSADPTGHIIEIQRIITALETFKPRLKIPRPLLKSSSTTVNLSASNSVPKGYTLAGFHGSSSSNIGSFEKGLDTKKAGSAHGQKYGDGFYATLDIDFAGNYAKQSIEKAYKHNKLKPRFPYAETSYDPAVANTSYSPIDKIPTVFGVYVKDYPLKKPGIDFTYIPGEQNTIAGSEIVFPFSMYDSIHLEPIASLASPASPWTANLKKRKK